MKSNYKQLLRNPDIQPTSEIIAEALQDANDSYIRFLNELANFSLLCLNLTQMNYLDRFIFYLISKKLEITFHNM